MIVNYGTIPHIFLIAHTQSFVFGFSCSYFHWKWISSNSFTNTIFEANTFIQITFVYTIFTIQAFTPIFLVLVDSFWSNWHIWNSFPQTENFNWKLEQLKTWTTQNLNNSTLEQLKTWTTQSLNNSKLEQLNALTTQHINNSTL